MKRNSISTPCPAPTDGSSSHRLSISSAYNNTVNEDTAHIEYTRAFEPTIRNTKPRRSSLVHGKMAKKAPVTVFEEVKEDEELVISKPLGKSTLLSKPARKPAVGAMAGGGRGVEQLAGGSRELGQSRARASLGGAELGISRVERMQQMPGVGGGMADRRKSIRSEDLFGPAIKKEPRRKTIFIPEDTTICTIHPGANTTAGLDDTFNIQLFPDEVSTQPEEKAEDKTSHLSKPVRRPRMSLSAAPRRVPLVPIRPSEYTDGFDVCGHDTGKENLAPGAQKSFKPTTKSSPDGRRHMERMAHPKASQPTATQSHGANAVRINRTVRPSLMQPTAATHARQINAARPAVPVPTALSRASQATRGAPPPTAAPRATKPLSAATTAAKPTMRHSMDNARPSLSRNNSPRNSPSSNANNANNATEKKSLRQHIDMKRLELQASKLSLYPVLPENLSQPELYEDRWLSQQEVALTEVINEIFAAAERHSPIGSQTMPLRESLIAIYHQPEVAMLHQRLQASLIYGALSRPRATSTTADPARDIGLRKKFISLFLETYDEDSLRAATEVIVGRQIPKRDSTGDANGIISSEQILDPRAGRRALTGFLETFFVSPADIDFAECARAGDNSDHETIRWRKSILRSVLLVWLLDQAKASDLVNGCLFKKTSAKKSSTAVLVTFAGMMMPSVGDIVRAMKQFDYEVSHVQDPLDEVHYEISNLAVHLRDGIMLTRLVEILLYNQKTIPAASDDANATITIQMPDSTQLLSEMYLPDTSLNGRLLSQHLKMPCLGHAQKHFNVQIALSALENHGIRGANVVGDIATDDLVNGHREKTLSLLWSLVSTFGLSHLVDFKYVALDAHRGEEKAIAQESLNHQEPEKLLLEWAAAYAAKQGVKVTNLTTSFANGKAYSAILCGFQVYISSTNNGATTLEARLTALGCSTAFVKQLTSSVGNIPSRETTVSNLAFLASRLLPLSRQHHAALILQRAYRQHRAPMVASQHIALMRLAHNCARVVQTQQRAVAAAVTIQRAWRAVLDARISKLSSDVEVFQSLARGWGARRRMRRNGGLTGRVMGGW
ncbi:hypothetical protein M409DRAFT_64769 [Zasmidium cellare ATCC 36951]|uniref:Calponin-homology (CH) domain-containing protein n=1 Tax=Zasmidium cellare ATCC 36951 TaxID=1080233 RepID=A0A6A6CSR7_ZASCE|nr:uncharacterized protein M409DRAFT_64769 [Zasmidium cellare ATCC 36951]KAF2169743.1 hypothetical protein M409DRAFT_64769 [Zasmidium cellare ATCC 36951]